MIHQLFGYFNLNVQISRPLQNIDILSYIFFPLHFWEETFFEVKNGTWNMG